MTIEKGTNRSVDNSKTRMWSMVNDEDDDAEKRRQRREYQQYVARMQALGDLSCFSYEKEDYEARMVCEEFTPPDPPDYSGLVPEAEALARQKYSPQWGAVCTFTVIAVFFDLLIMGKYKGILSIIFVLAAGFFIYQSLEKRRRRIEAAVTQARVRIKELLAEFYEAVKQEQARFIQEQQERIAEAQSILAGVLEAVLHVCQVAATQVRVPFALRGKIELFGAEPLISFELPDNDFVPVVEWEEKKAGGYLSNNLSPMTVNRLYAEAIAAAMIQVALRIFEQAPTIEAVSLNAFKPGQEKTVCLIGLRVSKADIRQVIASDSGLKVIEELGTIRPQLGFTLSAVSPVLPDWMETVVDREIYRGSINCSYYL